MRSGSFLSEALSSWWALVTGSLRWSVALLELQKHHAADPYQLVLLACRMPDLNGLDVGHTCMDTPNLEGMTVIVPYRTADVRISQNHINLRVGGILSSRPAILRAEGHQDSHESTQGLG